MVDDVAAGIFAAVAGVAAAPVDAGLADGAFRVGGAALGRGDDNGPAAGVRVSLISGRALTDHGAVRVRVEHLTDGALAARPHLQARVDAHARHAGQLGGTVGVDGARATCRRVGRAAGELRVTHGTRPADALRPVALHAALGVGAARLVEARVDAALTAARPAGGTLVIRAAADRPTALVGVALEALGTGADSLVVLAVTAGVQRARVLYGTHLHALPVDASSSRRALAVLPAANCNT